MPSASVHANKSNNHARWPLAVACLWLERWREGGRLRQNKERGEFCYTESERDRQTDRDTEWERRKKKKKKKNRKKWTYWWVNCVIDDKRAFPPQTGLIQKAQQALSKLKSSGPAPSCYHSSAAAADRSLKRMVSGSKVVLKACTPFPTWNVILFSHLVESGTDGGLPYGGYFWRRVGGGGGGGGGGRQMLMSFHYSNVRLCPCNTFPDIIICDNVCVKLFIRSTVSCAFCQSVSKLVTLIMPI